MWPLAYFDYVQHSRTHTELLAPFPLEAGPERTVQAGIEDWDVCIVLLSDLAAEWPKTVSLSQPGPETGLWGWQAHLD